MPKKIMTDENTEGETQKAEEIIFVPAPVTISYYETGRWGGKEQYQCKHCAFDTLELDAIVAHLFWAHSILL